MKIDSHLRILCDFLVKVFVKLPVSVTFPFSEIFPYQFHLSLTDSLFFCQQTISVSVNVNYTVKYNIFVSVSYFSMLLCGITDLRNDSETVGHV